MVEKIHTSEVIKFLKFCEDGCTKEMLANKFQNNEFENCSGSCFNLDELISFLSSKGAIELKDDMIFFKGCPGSGC